MTETRYPRDGQTPPIIRQYAGWIILAVLMLIMIGLTLMPSTESQDRAVELSEAQSTFKSALAAGGEVANFPLGGSSRQQFQDIEKKAAATHRTDPIAAEIYAAARFELHEPISVDEIQALKKSHGPVEQRIYQIYAARSLTPDQAESLSKDLNARGFFGSLVEAHAFEKAGDPSKRRALEQQSQSGFLVAKAVVLAVLCTSLLGWAGFAVLKLSGRLPVLGFPIRVHNLPDADFCAMKAAQVLAADIGFQSSVPLLLFKLPLSGAGKELLVGVFLLVALPFVVQAMAFGRRASLADLGIEKESLGKHVLIGLFGFAMELPVTSLLAIVGTSLLSRGKEVSHPAEVSLLNSHDPLRIFSLFVLASIVAPLYEEILFRGLLFPAVAKVTGSMVWSAVITSFVFASLHPQGFPAWLALAMVGGMSCLLVVHTKSLVPSLVLHCAHNSTLLFVALLYS